LRKAQLPLTILGLLLVLGLMNYASDLRQQHAEARAKAVEQARKEAETKAQVAKSGSKPNVHGQGDDKAFDLPANSGPVSAPVKLEVFVNNANSCHASSTTLKDLQQVYGSLLRIEWLSMTDPKVSERSDKLSIGCEAGLIINGRIEVEISRYGGKTLMAFRGPIGDKYKINDVYAAINAMLVEKGKQPPAAAVQKGKL
jgi:hypothetical protein